MKIFLLKINIFLTIIAFVLLTGCEKDGFHQLLNKEKMIKTKINSIVMISDLTNEHFNAACLLNPYQEKIEEKYSESLRVNKFLRSIRFKADESNWSLVLLKNESEVIYTFDRSKYLDIFPVSGMKNLVNVDIPSNFEKTQCASFNRAGLYKTSINNRIFLIFGSVK